MDFTLSSSHNAFLEEATTAEPEPPALTYTYKSYTPTPTVHYICDEGQANDLVGKLNGPIGLDIEWRTFYTGSAEDGISAVARSSLPTDPHDKVSATPGHNVILPEASPNDKSMEPTVKVFSKQRPAAIVQVSDEKLILVIQLHAEGRPMGEFPQKLRGLLESKDVIKMGVNILGDGQKLCRDYGISACNLVELSILARQADPEANAAFTTKNGRGLIKLESLVAHYCGKTLVKSEQRSNWEAAVLSQDQIEYAANDVYCGLMVYKGLIELAKGRGRTLAPEAYTSHVGIAVTGEKYQASTTSKVRQRDAYVRWHEKGDSLEKICADMRSEANPLSAATVISYVIDALKTDETLPFDMENLWSLVRMHSWARSFYKPWILSAAVQGRGGPARLRIASEVEAEVREGQ